MTLLLTVFAAVASTAVWYLNDEDLKMGTLCFLYWGASVMWFVDCAAEYIEDGAAIFEPSISQLANDAFLGLAVIALGLVIWLVRLLFSDPRGKVRKTLEKEKRGGK